MDCSPPGSSVHGLLQARILEWIAIPFFRGSFWPGFELRSPALQADSLPSEPPRKSKYMELLHNTTFLCPWDFPGKNTGVACNFLLQGIFLNQWSNTCLVHGKWILYLSHQGSLGKEEVCANLANWLNNDSCPEMDSKSNMGFFGFSKYAHLNHRCKQLKEILEIIIKELSQY